MLDAHLEPDYRTFKRRDVEDFYLDTEPTEEEIRIAEHNYECKVYGEPEKMIWRKQCLHN